MSLPEQIRKQSEAVQKLYQQMDASAEGAAGTEAAAAQPATPVEPVPTAPAAVPADSGAQPVQPVAAAEPPASGVSTDDFEQKYKTLQGMFNNEVPRLHAERKDLQTRLSQAEALLATLSSVPATQPTPTQSLVTDEDKTAYGDSIDMMRKVAREEGFQLQQKLHQMETALNNLAASLNTSVLPQVRQVAQRQAVSAEEQFWANLSNAVPQWQQINNDPDFKSWLLEVDHLSGVTRQSFLEQAQSALDVQRVIHFFRTFADQTGKFGFTPAVQPTTPVQPSRAASELEQQVAPGRSRGGTPPTASAAKTYTPADIKKFYEDVRTGAYKGREPERNRIEHDIFAARREGRLVVNTN